MFIGLEIKDKKRQRALLPHYAGEDVNDIFDTLEGTGEDFATAKQKLKDYFAPKKNTEYEVYKLRRAKQSANETIDSFHTSFHNCEFTENDIEVKSQIIQGCQSTRLGRKAIREDLNLETLLSSARALEISEKQATEIEHADTDFKSAHVIRKLNINRRRNKR